MQTAWRVVLGAACVALALGLYIAYGPQGEEGSASPAPSTTAPATTGATTTAPAGPVEYEFTIDEKGVDEPLAQTATAGEEITWIVTSSVLGHIAVEGDEEAGGFVEQGKNTIKFTIEKPGTYVIDLHTEAPAPIPLGEIVVT
jgi:plastocyanin